MSESSQLPANPSREPQRSAAPVTQLQSNRGLFRFIVFTILTLGIYPLIFFSGISTDINIIASRYDGKKTMHYCLLLLIVSPLTLGLGYFVWMHRLCGRIGGELARRRKEILLTSASFWLWHVLGCLILIGPLVFIHKLAVAANTLADDFNAHG